jgi:hypothetical protein
MSLDRLVGTWQFTMQHVAVAEPVVGRQRYDRVLGGAFVRLDWTYEHPQFPDALCLLDDRAVHYFDARGVTRVFDLTIDDQGWSMVRRDPDFWQRSTGRFLGPDAADGTGENSFDGGESWQHDFSITYTRVG